MFEETIPVSISELQATGSKRAWSGIIQSYSKRYGKDEDIMNDGQLTQSISLSPSEEEIKKKGWWQFWK